MILISKVPKDDVNNRMISLASEFDSEAKALSIDMLKTELMLRARSSEKVKAVLLLGPDLVKFENEQFREEFATALRQTSAACTAIMLPTSMELIGKFPASVQLHRIQKLTEKDIQTAIKSMYDTTQPRKDVATNIDAITANQALRMNTPIEAGVQSLITADNIRDVNKGFNALLSRLEDTAKYSAAINSMPNQNLAGIAELIKNRKSTSNINLNTVEEDMKQNSPLFQELQEELKLITDEMSKARQGGDSHVDILKRLEQEYATRWSIHNKMLHAAITSIAEQMQADIERSVERTNDFIRKVQSVDVEDLLATDVAQLDSLRAKRDELKTVIANNFENTQKLLMILETSGAQLTTKILNEGKLLQETVNLGSHSETNMALVTQETSALAESVGISLQNSTKAITMLKATIQGQHKNVTDLVRLDDTILAGMDKVNNILMTQNVHKTVVVDRNIKSKLHLFMGADFSGKTTLAYACARAMAGQNKTVCLIDGNILNPKLRFIEPPVSEALGGIQGKLSKRAIEFSSFFTLFETQELKNHLPNDNGLTLIMPTEKKDYDYYAGLVSPEDFFDRLLHLLQKVELLYDRILLILPEDAFAFMTLLGYANSAILVTDQSGYSLEVAKQLRKEISAVKEQPVVKTIVRNKVTANSITADELFRVVDASMSEYVARSVRNHLVFDRFAIGESQITALATIFADINKGLGL